MLKDQIVNEFGDWNKNDGIANKVFRRMRDTVIDMYNRRYNDQMAEEDYCEPILELGYLIKEQVEDLGPNIKFIEMTDRPFGFIYNVAGKSYRVVIKNKNYMYEQTKKHYD